MSVQLHCKNLNGNGVTPAASQGKKETTKITVVFTAVLETNFNSRFVEKILHTYLHLSVEYIDTVLVAYYEETRNGFDLPSLDFNSDLITEAESSVVRVNGHSFDIEKLKDGFATINKIATRLIPKFNAFFALKSFGTIPSTQTIGYGYCNEGQQTAQGKIAQLMFAYSLKEMGLKAAAVMKQKAVADKQIEISEIV